MIRYDKYTTVVKKFAVVNYIARMLYLCRSIIINVFFYPLLKETLNTYESLIPSMYLKHIRRNDQNYRLDYNLTHVLVHFKVKRHDKI